MHTGLIDYPSCRFDKSRKIGIQHASFAGNLEFFEHMITALPLSFRRSAPESEGHAVSASWQLPGTGTAEGRFQRANFSEDGPYVSLNRTAEIAVPLP
jgi:hypothetical protein